MTKDTLKITTLAAAIASVPVLAFAQLALGDTIGMEETDIRAILEAKGAVVLEIEIDEDEIEVEYLLDGVTYEAEIDPVTGKLAELSLEDDEDDDHEGLCCTNRVMGVLPLSPDGPIPRPL